MRATLRAAKQKVQRVELTVRASNTAAIALYHKVGFVYEGAARKGWYIDGQYDDIWHMGLLFGEDGL